MALLLAARAAPGDKPKVIQYAHKTSDVARQEAAGRGDHCTYKTTCFIVIVFFFFITTIVIIIISISACASRRRSIVQCTVNRKPVFFKSFAPVPRQRFCTTIHVGGANST